ncbi:MAG: patatin-like phospholipase family protein [Bacillota bacterium]
MYGLVLEGGGAKGAYQAGAIKALLDNDYKFELITGTSIGAINGAFLVQGNFNEIYELWEEADISKLINTDKKVLDELLNLNIGEKNLSKILKYLIKTIKAGGLDITPLKELLIENIDEEKIRKSDTDFGLVTVSLSDFEPLELFIKDIEKGKLIDYILASANLPIFKSDKLDGKVLIDGGFYNNRPVNMVIDKGIKDIIVIETQGIGRKPKINEDGLNIIKITPSEKISKSIEVEPKIMKKSLKVGYLDALRKISDFYGYTYYIKFESSKKEILKNIINLSSKQLNSLKTLFNYQEDIYLTHIFEEILPFMSNLLKIDKPYSYLDLFISFNEYIAKLNNLENLKVYSYDEIIKLNYKNIKDKEIKFNDKYKYISNKVIFKSVDLMPKKIIDKFLIELYKIIYRE